MSFAKILFVGLGGAGKRHLRILRQLLPKKTVFTAYRRTSRTPLLRPDFTVDERNTVEAAYDLQVFDSLQSAFADGPDLTVISTPSSCHREPMMMAMEVGSGVLVRNRGRKTFKISRSLEMGLWQNACPFTFLFSVVFIH